MRTVTRLYDKYSTAQEVVRTLENAGIPETDISLVASDRGEAAAPPGSAGLAASPVTYPGMSGTGITETGATSAGPTGTGPSATPSGEDAASGAGTGAIAGTVVGGGLGLLAGLGSLALPGIGPVVAAGWLVATLTGAGLGAGAGGLVGSLTGAGVSREESDLYAEEVSRGGALVSVRVNEDREAETAAIMDRHDPVNWQERRASYGADWCGSDAGRSAGGAVPGVGGTPSARAANPVDAAPDRSRQGVMETASRRGEELDKRIDAAEDRLRDRAADPDAAAERGSGVSKP